MADLNDRALVINIAAGIATPLMIEVISSTVKSDPEKGREVQAIAKYAASAAEAIVDAATAVVKK